jgi:hypothetical protein
MRVLVAEDFGVLADALSRLTSRSPAGGNGEARLTGHG